MSGKIKAGKAFGEGNSLALSLSKQRVARERQWKLEVRFLNRGINRERGKEMIMRVDGTHRGVTYVLYTSQPGSTSPSTPYLGHAQ